jgi:hypothetical protein
MLTILRQFSSSTALIPASSPPKSMQRSAENRWRARSAHGLCCIATEVFLANYGAAPRLRCRSKVAQKAPITSDTPGPTLGSSGQPNRRRIGFLRLHRGTSHSRIFGCYTLSRCV